MTDPNYPAKPGRDEQKRKLADKGIEPLALDFANAETQPDMLLRASTVISLKRIADALDRISGRGGAG